MAFGALRAPYALLISLLLLTGASDASAGRWPACNLLLLKNQELAYFAAETPAARSAALRKFFAAVENARPAPEAQIATESLSAAWWRIAFARRSGPVTHPGQMEMSELNNLVRSKDTALYMDALKTAYEISEFRIRANRSFVRAGAAVAHGLKKAGRWTTTHTTAFVPRPLRERAETILEKTRRTRPVRATESTARKVGRAIGRLPPYLQIQAGVSNANRARTVTLYAALKLRSILLAGADFVSPLHLRTFLPERWLERTDPIFTKLEKNPAFLPVGEDLATLRKYGAEDAFARRQAMLQKNPKWFKSLRLADTTWRWGVAGFTASAIGLAFMQSSWGDAPLTVEDYLKQPLLPNQVQLINETVPFPHLAIRIGNIVYSYGVREMTATPAEVYLRTHQPNGDGSGTFFERQRSVQVATLNLSPEKTAQMRAHFDLEAGKAYDFAAIERDMTPEYRKLRRHLALQAGKEYENITFVNDCATMAARALRQFAGIDIPTTLDPSPSSVLLYLGAEKQLGNPQVESVRVVLGSARQNETLQLLRNAYINAREARLYFQPIFFATNQATRAVIDQTRTKDELQHFTADFVARQTARSDEVEREVKNDIDLAYYLKRKDQIAKDPDLQEETAAYFAETYANQLEIVESNYSELDAILGALYKLEYYAEAERSLLNRSSFDLAKSLDDPEFTAEIRDLLESIELEKP